MIKDIKKKKKKKQNKGEIIIIRDIQIDIKETIIIGIPFIIIIEINVEINRILIQKK